MPSETRSREDGSFERLEPAREGHEPPDVIASVGLQADLFVAGKIPFPRDLSADVQRLLRNAIRERLRRRLVVVVARAIARDLSEARRRPGE